MAEFLGETPVKVGNYNFSRKCEMKKGELDLFVINDCGEGELLSLNDLFKRIDGYDETITQTLTHDTDGNLLRS